MSLFCFVCSRSTTSSPTPFHPQHKPTTTTTTNPPQPDDVDGYGQAPLHLAALRGNLPVVEYLVLDADAQTGRKVRIGGLLLVCVFLWGYRRVGCVYVYV